MKVVVEHHMYPFVISLLGSSCTSSEGMTGAMEGPTPAIKGPGILSTDPQKPGL